MRTYDFKRRLRKLCAEAIKARPGRVPDKEIQSINKLMDSATKRTCADTHPDLDVTHKGNTHD